MNPALVILAAGESRRLGLCKALVDLGGRTGLARLLEAGRAMDGARPLVVTGAHDVAIRSVIPSGVDVLFNPDWAAGRTGGVALASGARPGLDLAIAPVDVPLVPTEVFDALCAAWIAHDAPARGWLAPCVSRKVAGEFVADFGHPVVVGRDLVRELVTTGKDFPHSAPRARPETLRDLRRLAAPMLSIPVESARILDDLDTPDDLERLRALVS